MDLEVLKLRLDRKNLVRPWLENLGWIAFERGDERKRLVERFFED